MSEESKVKIAKEILENFNKQIILYGPPGTSKTYYSTLIAANIIKHNKRRPDKTCPDKDKTCQDNDCKGECFKENNYEEAKKYLEGEGKKYYQLVQFHPSYNYDDFVRGIKMSIDNGTPKYEIVNKVFGEFAERAAKDRDNKYVLVIDEINRAPLASVLGELIYGLEYRGRKVTIPYAYERESDELTIEGNTKIQIKDIETEESNGSGNKEYYTDKNGFVMKNKNKVYTSDGNEITIKSVGGKKKLMELINYIVVPVNLYIIGTMNTADRSIGSIDYAVRRRFSFISLPSDWKIVEASWNNMINKYFDEKIQQKQKQQKKEATNEIVNNGIKNLCNAIKKLIDSAGDNKEDINRVRSYFLNDENKFNDMQIEEQTEAQKSELDYLYKRIENRLYNAIKPILGEYVKDCNSIEGLLSKLNCDEKPGSKQSEQNKEINIAKWSEVEESWSNMINKYFKDATNKRVNNGIKNLYDAINELKYSADVNKEDIMIGHSYFLYDANKFKVTQIKKQTEESELNYLCERIKKYFQYRLDYEIKPILREYVKDGLIENGEVIEKLSLELNCEEQSGSAQPEQNKGANTADTASAS